MKKSILSCGILATMPFQALSNEENKIFDSTDLVLSIAEEIIKTTPLEAIIHIDNQNTNSQFNVHTQFNFSPEDSWKLEKRKYSSSVSSERNYHIELYKVNEFSIELDYLRRKSFQTGPSLANQRSTDEKLGINLYYQFSNDISNSEVQRIKFNSGFRRYREQNDFGLDFNPNEFELGLSFEVKF